jgi:hypothetical protein
MGFTTLPTTDGARSLLNSEQYGFAIDATTYDSVTAAAYVGGPVGGTLAIHADNVTDKPNIPLDAAAGLLKGVSPLVNSGTSPKMVHHAASPYVRWSAHNLTVQSQTFDNVSWTKTNTTVTANDAVAPDGTTTAEKIEATTTGSGRFIRVDNTTVSGFQYTGSAYIKAGNINWCAVYLINSAGTSYAGSYFNVGSGTEGTNFAANWTLASAEIVSVGSGWYRLSVTTTVDATTARLVIELDSADANNSVTAGDYVHGWGAQVNRGPIATPYLATTTAARIGIPQSYDAAAAQYGILVEPAATNIFLQSEDLTTTWSNTNTTETANATTAPDGTLTADKLVEASDAGAQHAIVQSPSVTSGSTYTFSGYFKQGERTWLQISVGTLRFPDNFKCNFNLATGAKGTIGAGCSDSSITSIGDGWYRCSITATADSTGGASVSFFLAEADDDVAYAGDGTSGFYVWGAQAEVGSVPTSYIPTLGSTVTRAADDVACATSSIPFSATNGTIVASVVPRIVNNAAAVRAWSLNDGTNNEMIYVGALIASTPDEYFFDVVFGGVSQCTGVQSGTFSASGNKVAASWAANDFALATDGDATPATDTGGTLPTVTTLDVGMLGTGTARELNGFVKTLVYLPRTMTDGQLTTASTP